MKQLPVVSVSNPFEKWLLPVRDAIINTNGVFAISGMRADLTWEQGCKLCKKILKSYMKSTQHNPYELHLGLDLHKGQGRSTSCLHNLKTEGNSEDHISKGLFNIVIGDRSELRGLQLQNHGGEYQSVLQKLIQVSYRNAFAVVIPGYTLQFFEPDLLAARFRFQNQIGTETVQVFQCRLNPHYQVNGEEIGKILIEAFNKSERESLIIKVKPLDGKETYLEITSATSVADLAKMYCLAFGKLVQESRFLYAGRQLEVDERMVFDYIPESIASGDMVVIHHVGRLIGD